MAKSRESYIIEALRKAINGLTSQELVEKTGMNLNSIRMILRGLISENRIKKERQYYASTGGSIPTWSYILIKD